MHEYKVIKTRNTKEAEDVMNEMAKSGWRVIAVTTWVYYMKFLVITFER